MLISSGVDGLLSYPGPGMLIQRGMAASGLFTSHLIDPLKSSSVSVDCSVFYLFVSTLEYKLTFSPIVIKFKWTSQASHWR